MLYLDIRKINRTNAVKEVRAKLSAQRENATKAAKTLVFVIRCKEDNGKHVVINELNDEQKTFLYKVKESVMIKFLIKSLPVVLTRNESNEVVGKSFVKRVCRDRTYKSAEKTAESYKDKYTCVSETCTVEIGGMPVAAVERIETETAISVYSWLVVSKYTANMFVPYIQTAINLWIDAGSPMK